jgi:uncharacterized membrane protein
MQVLFTFGATLLILPAWLRGKRQVKRNHSAGLALGALSGVLASLANFWLFKAIHSGDVSVVVPMTALSPLVTFLLGAFILKEKMSRSQYVGVGLAIVAILMLST